VREKSLLEAIASSLTEMFSPNIISQRVSGMLRNYDFVTPETLAYFTPRLTQAPQDVAFALAYVKEHATRPRSRSRCSMRCASNATCSGRSSMRCTSPMSSLGMIPPGAFVPEKA
jgi:pyrroloquinoline-quinone synthase